ncbi:hypothetical protein AB0D10_22455 [Kitasatospora sp. NPDC048545]|uniref:hypothetical protein n=1 Tax=Kitasatospora sp. NPDC048545 TaxID=3157208 RepID=UPI0033F6A0A7
MNHRIARTLVLLAAAGLAAVPTAASAEVVSGGNHGTVIIGDNNQVAGYDIINAGHDATVGSHNGGSGTTGMTGVASSAIEAAQATGGNYGTVIIGDDNQVAGDDIVNALNDATVGSYNGSSTTAGTMNAAPKPVTR